MSQNRTDDLLSQIGTREDLKRRRAFLRANRNRRMIKGTGHVSMTEGPSEKDEWKHPVKGRSPILEAAFALKEPMTAIDFAEQQGVSRSYAERCLKKANKFMRFNRMSVFSIAASKLQHKMTAREFASLHNISEDYAYEVLSKHGKHQFARRDQNNLSMGMAMAKRLKKPMTIAQFAKKTGLSKSYAGRCLRAAGKQIYEKDLK